MTPQVTVFDDLKKFGPSIAIIDTLGNSFSYFELVQASDEYLLPEYCRKLFFFLGDNDFESIFAYVGLIKSGAILMLFPPDISQEKINALSAIYAPNYIWRKAKVGDAPETYKITPLSKDFDLKINPELSLLLATSGSTGSPKFVRLSYKNIIANTNSIIDSLGICASDCVITTLPFNYSYGLSIITTHLVSGSKIILSKFSVIEREFWDAIRREKVTTFGGVPYTYQMLSRISSDYFNNTSVKYLTQAGGKLSSPIIIQFLNTLEKISARFIVMYGQTEATARMSVALPRHLHESPETIGEPIPGGKFRILDSKLQVISQPNVIGEIEFSGENVCLGFAATREDLTLGDSNQGKLRTGDLGYFDEYGKYYVTGRNNRFLKLFGNRINLDDIQDYLTSLGITAACTGKEDKLRIYLEGTDQEALVIEEVVNFLSVHKSAVQTKVIDRLPRSESGKILYAELNQQS